MSWRAVALAALLAAATAHSRSLTASEKRFLSHEESTLFAEPDAEEPLRFVVLGCKASWLRSKGQWSSTAPYQKCRAAWPPRVVTDRPWAPRGSILRAPPMSVLRAHRLPVASARLDPV